MAFKVIKIVDGDTFVVSPNWKWKNESGDIVRPTGYNTPEVNEEGYEQAKQKLSDLILNQVVELKNPVDFDHGRLVCDVFFEGRNLADYFTEYKV